MRAKDATDLLRPSIAFGLFWRRGLSADPTSAVERIADDICSTRVLRILTKSRLRKFRLFGQMRDNLPLFKWQVSAITKCIMKLFGIAALAVFASLTVEGVWALDCSVRFKT
ncbi:hypothetical protein DXU04_11955 [Bradyrhizobium diazoefficiens]|jgi:hypothetical protein|nr:hypothetical protein AF336_04230 [Bradyrhizobium diazoefficiens]